MTVSNHPNPSRTWAETLSSPLRTAFQHPWVEGIVRLGHIGARKIDVVGGDQGRVVVIGPAHA